jgi:hypothetical protein
LLDADRPGTARSRLMLCSAIIQSVIERPSFLANIRSAGRREPASN